MALPELAGHAELRSLLGGAVRDGGLPQSVLLHGPAGAGKERLGLWLAQRILCADADVEPCGDCQSCRLVLRLEHPDVHWFFPLPRPDASSPEKLRDRLEEHRAAELQQWREKPLRVPEYERAPAHFLASVRTMQQLAAMRPAAGSQKVFVVGDADLMVPQESSPEAANAFLKLLEEPPPSTTVVLTSSHPGALLPTIRSRVLSIRVAPLPMDALERLLVSGGVEAEQARRAARTARGSARRAFRLAARDPADSGDPERRVGRELLIAALTSGAVARLAAANARRPAGARNELVAELESLAGWLRDLAAVAAGAPERVLETGDLPLLRRAVEKRGVTIGGIVRAIARVSEARELALGNVNPQLIVADLLAKLQEDLTRGLASSRAEVP